jgi:hypothetical protein
MTSKTDLNRAVERINRMHGLKLTVGWAYGKPRVHNHDESRDISPRLPSGELLRWLHAFERGFEAAKSGETFGPRSAQK